MTDAIRQLPMSSPVAETGQILRAARAKVGMTRKQLAQASGTSERYLAHLESGDGNPSLNVLVALGHALDIALPELLPMGGERSPAIARMMSAIRRLPKHQWDALEEWLGDVPAHLQRGAKAQRVILIGMRGAGKSTLGSRLAEMCCVPFVEMTKLVEDDYGGDIGLLIEMSGQAALRRYEQQAWKSICEKYDSAIVAVPGGIVADAGLYEQMLATAHSVWLQATPEDHMSRVMAQGDFRPMASNRSAMADLKAILEARSPDYALADLHFNTSGLDSDRAAQGLSVRVADIFAS